MKIRSYSDLQRLPTFEERLEYLTLKGAVGQKTFGFDRWMNQNFYRSKQWKSVRQEVILRDNGCDLGVPGHEIAVYLLIHHMNPVTQDDIRNTSDWLLDPEYLITTTRQTHNAIHYGIKSLTPKTVIRRERGDTKLW